MTLAPPVPYFGGKQRIAEQIVATFPAHTHYVEPFAGGLSVLLAKPASRMETINDLDGDLMTFWRVLRNRPDELIMQCTFTPLSRAEMVESHHRPDGLSELEVARRVWVELTQGRAAKTQGTGWRFYLDGAAANRGMSGYLAAYVRRIPAAAARLAEVALEARDAVEVVHDYGQHPTNLLYVDPPYLGATRNTIGYRHEMKSASSHAALAEALATCTASVVLSGYDSALYAQLYSDWNRIEIKASAQQANSALGNSRTEVLWTNFQDEHLFSEVTA